MHQIAHVGVSPSKSLKLLIGREIIFEELQAVGKSYLNITDRQMDGRTDRQTNLQTTYCGITALCLASRGNRLAAGLRPDPLRDLECSPSRNLGFGPPGGMVKERGGKKGRRVREGRKQKEGEGKLEKESRGGEEKEGTEGRRGDRREGSGWRHIVRNEKFLFQALLIVMFIAVLTSKPPKSKINDILTTDKTMTLPVKPPVAARYIQWYSCVTNRRFQDLYQFCLHIFRGYPFWPSSLP